MKLISLVVVGALGVCVAACKFDRPPPIVDGPLPEVDAAPDSMVDPAVLSSEQTSHDFTDVTVGGQSIDFDVVVRNTGPTTSGALQVALSGEAGEFEIVAGAGCQDVLLGPDELCTTVVRFGPISEGAHAAALEISAAPGGMATVELLGRGLSPGSLEITAGAVIDFAQTELGSQSGIESVTVRNNGGTATAALTVELPDAYNFLKVPGGDSCNGIALGAGLTCTVQVRFKPTVVNDLSTQLSIRESDSVGVPATLSGTGSARLRVTKSGTGTGTITSTQAGIACGAACATSEVSFNESPITLTASVVSGHAFEGWGPDGACASAGTNPECIVSLTQARTDVTATFRAWECTPDSIECNDAIGRYVDCSPTGTIELAMDCPLGCGVGVEKCLDVAPSNGVAPYLDQAATDPASRDIALGGASTMNTTTGVVLNGATGMSVSVPHASFGGMRIFMFRSLSIAGTLRVTGTLPAVVVSDGAVLITGTLDVSGDGRTTSGPGGVTSGACVGGGVGTSSWPGGGGAGNATRGGLGGSGNGVAGGIRGSNVALASLQPLSPGCFGGPGRFANSAGAPGGAVQIVSRVSISVTGSGMIDASGGGGQGSTIAAQLSGGAGGGSGGAILLEAVQVILDGSGVVLSTKGGGGAAGGDGTTAARGRDGETDALEAPGGTNAPYGAGGAGGTATIPAVSGATSASSAAGGGGGGVGAVRINTLSGGFSPINGATIRSTSSIGLLGIRQIP